MFGYVNVLAQELKVKEYALFKAYYCGLCRVQGKLCGPMTRLGLSYDQTVLAVLLDGLARDSTQVEKKLCSVNPLCRKPMVVQSPALEYAAHMSVILGYYKIKDDLRDEGFAPSIGMLPFYAPAYRTAKKKYPEKTMVIEENLDTLARLEKEGTRDIDMLSNCFGNIMETVFDFDANNARVLRRIGFELGKWIYTIDAIDDFEKDKKKERFTPFDNIEDIKKIQTALWYNLSNVAKAYDLLHLRQNGPITDNVVYMGLCAVTEKILSKTIGETNESISNTGH